MSWQPASGRARATLPPALAPGDQPVGRLAVQELQVQARDPVLADVDVLDLRAGTEGAAELLDDDDLALGHGQRREDPRPALAEVLRDRVLLLRLLPGHLAHELEVVERIAALEGPALHARPGRGVLRQQVPAGRALLEPARRVLAQEHDAENGPLPAGDRKS